MMKAVIANPQLVRDWLRREGKTMRELAEDLGVTDGHLSKLLRQEVTPSFGLLVDLAHAMGLKVWWELLLPPELAVVRREDAELLADLQRRYARRLMATSA